MLTKFGSGIWITDGPVVTAAVGFHYPTRMAVIRPANSAWPSPTGRRPARGFARSWDGPPGKS